MAKTVVITRFKLDDKKDVAPFREWVSVFTKSGEIDRVYIICSKDDEKKLKKLKFLELKNKTKIIFKPHNKPTSPTSMNSIIGEDFLKEPPQFFIVASKEIAIEGKNIEKLILEINGDINKKLLVVGYKFKIENGRKLNRELQDYYDNKELIAYHVPWNTCAIWKYELFAKNVGKFDEITARNPFDSIGISIDGVCSKTDHEGMEDGLAIAAAANSDKEIKSGLLDDFLSWAVDTKGEPKHREKLARKDTVLRNFMAVRNYSIEDLEKATIS